MGTKLVSLKEIFEGLAKPKFEKIDTVKEMKIEKLLDKMQMNSVKLPAPKTKKEAQNYLDFYVEILNWHGEQMKHIKRNVLPGLREMLK